MPPRRTKQADTAEKAEPKAATRTSARSATNKAVAAPAKPAPTRTTKKRGASPESSRTPPPVVKRARAGKAAAAAAAEKEEPMANGDALPRKAKAPPKRATTPALKKHGSKASTEPALNEVPAFPEPMRPAGQLFVWGCGDFGQFGLGPKMLQEFSKPKKHTWAEEKMHEGMFGADTDGGIIAIAAGGMHSLFIDENGKVRVFRMSSVACTGVIVFCLDSS
jgi:regulator of chromosome condensation